MHDRWSIIIFGVIFITCPFISICSILRASEYPSPNFSSTVRILSTGILDPGRLGCPSGPHHLGQWDPPVKQWMITHVIYKSTYSNSEINIFNHWLLPISCSTQWKYIWTLHAFILSYVAFTAFAYIYIYISICIYSETFWTHWMHCDRGILQPIFSPANQRSLMPANWWSCPIPPPTPTVLLPPK